MGLWKLGTGDVDRRWPGVGHLHLLDEEVKEVCVHIGHGNVLIFYLFCLFWILGLN